MDKVISFIIAVVAMALASTIADSLMGDGAIKRSVAIVNGIAFLLAVIEPLLF